MNLRHLIIDDKLDQVRKKRDTLLPKLDLPFMRALEDDNDQLKEHIKSLKNFLRDLPNNLRFDEIEDNDIINYNPFGNIFEIILIHGGNGYKKPPKVTVDTPREPHIGFPPQVLAFIKDEKVSKIKILDYGCGYDFIPKVTIEAPEDGEQAFALCMPPQNVYLSEEDLKENTKEYYL